MNTNWPKSFRLAPGRRGSRRRGAEVRDWYSPGISGLSEPHFMRTPHGSQTPRNRGDSFRGALLGPRYWRADEAAAIQRAEELLARFGLDGAANEYAGDLSGGQRRLVEIMRALMAEPAVLLLDEPMAGVHPRLARRLGAELVALCAEGMTILMVEHELAIMDEFADPVVVMAEGTVLAEGTMAQLRGRSEVVEAYLVG